MNYPEEDGLTPFDAAIATRAAIEGIPVFAISRVLRAPAENVYFSLKHALATGSITGLPAPDWPPTGRLGDHLPVGKRVSVAKQDEGLVFVCHNLFKLTNVEAAFFVVLMKSDRVSRETLHAVVEEQRHKRAQQPVTEMTDPKIIDVFICKLRKKLSAVNRAFTILTIWGRGGYYIEQSVKVLLNARLATAGASNGQSTSKRTGDHSHASSRVSVAAG
jgi:hypothetical protein